MSRYVGIVRSNEGLGHAHEELIGMERSLAGGDTDAVHHPAWYELRNMITCSLLIVAQSLKRTENRGGFYNKNLETRAVLT